MKKLFLNTVFGVLFDRKRFLTLVLITSVLCFGMVPLVAQQFSTTVAFQTLTGTTATQQLFAPVATKSVTITSLGVGVGTGGTTGNTVTFFSCTAANCTTVFSGLTAVSEIFSGTAESVASGGPVIALPLGAGLFVASSAAAPYSVRVTGTQQ